MLVGVIQRGITAQGFFLLIDEGLELLSDQKFEPNDLTVLAKVHAFAAKHQWQAIVAGRTITFTPVHTAANSRPVLN